MVMMRPGDLCLSNKYYYTVILIKGLIYLQYQGEDPTSTPVNGSTFRWKPHYNRYIHNRCRQLYRDRK
jgi:hypothetical protein